MRSPDDIQTNKPIQTNRPDTDLSSSDTLTIKIDYTDTVGKRKSIEKEVPVSASSTTFSQDRIQDFKMGTKQESFFTKYKTQIIWIAGIILILWGYNKFRKRKLLSKK